MKQFLRSFFLLLLVIVWSSNALAVTSPYSYTFKSGGSFTADQQTKTLGGVNWTIASDGYLSYEGNNQAQQIGKKNSPAKNTEISTSDFSGTIKSVKINGWNGSAAKANVEVFVGNVSYGTKKFTTDKTSEYLFNGTSSGALKIKITNDAPSSGAVAYYIKTISVTYEDGPTKTATKLNFPQPAIIIEGGNEASFKGQTATLKTGETVLDKAITYAKSGDDIFATFDATTGAATLKTGVYGSATITATFAGDATYETSTASYKLTIVDPNAHGVTFDFSKPDKYGKDIPATNDETVIGVGNSIVSGIVSLTVTKESESSNAKSRFWNSRGEITYRLYSGAINTVSVPQGYVITAISITDNDNGKNKLVTIGENKDNSDWTGSAQSVQITATGSAVLETMTVAYSKLSTLSLDEAADDTDTKIANNNGKTLDVALTRSLKAGVWNTICLPFDVTAEQIKNILKATGNVKEFDKEDKATATIFFKPATEMKAGVPYLIKPTEDATVLNFKDVTINNVDELSRINGNDYCICGVFSKYQMDTNGSELFLTTQGKFAVPAPTTKVMRGFRAYFLVPKNTAGAALNLSFGEATSIDGVAVDAVKSVKIYNVNGQYVGTSLDALPKGLYIVGGKKVLK
ncbi:MAG: hypothetical protein MR489_05065 [Prevotella sp.]|nr:hypothetical protein [Prevotella sp.]